jgi:poly(3-hydroxyalkanoate) synthetase
MNYETWLRLLPYVKEYLPKDYIESIENDGNNLLNIVGYNHGAIVVHSIAGITTEKEIKTILTNRILKSKKFNDAIKLEILELINEE